MAAGHVSPRIALVGYGNIAPKHVEVLRELGADVVAACNRSEEGRRKAQAGGIARTYGSIAEMLDRERPDGVVDCAVFPQIHPTALEILPRGIPTLLEKPPGTSLAQLRELEAVAREHHTPVMVGLNRRFYSVVERAIADAGGPEAITSVMVEWSEDPVHVGKRFTADEVARWIFGNSLHGLDLLTTLAGPIDAPAIVARDHGAPFRWVMALQGVSQRGVVASFTSTWDAPGRWRVSFCAAGRRYVFAPLETCTVLERGNQERVIEPSAEDRRFKAGFHTQARMFLEMIATRQVPERASLESARPSMALAQALTDALVGRGAAAPA